MFDFPVRFFQGADKLCISEGQAYLTFSYFLVGLAEDEFNFVLETFKPLGRRVICWPEAAHYLLRSSSM